MRIIVLSLFYLYFLFTPIEPVADTFRHNVGDKPPDYTLSKADAAGKVVVVDAYATWCPPCLKELPVLERLQRHLGPDLIRVIAVNHRESKKKFRLIKEAFNDSPITLTYDKGNRIAKKYGVKAIPHLVIIGKDGKVSYQVRGYGEDSIDMLVEKINQHLQT